MKRLRTQVVFLDAELAWPGGDRPGEPDFIYEPPAAVSEGIADALGPLFPPAAVAGARYRALSPPVGPVGRYRLSTPEGSWFIRVSSRSGSPKLEKSITRYLFNRGVDVNPLLVAGEVLRWEGQTFRADVRPMIEGRHFNGSIEDITSLASTLSACHRAFLNFPGALEIRTAAAIRYKHLAEIRDLIADALKRGAFELFAEYALWVSSHRSWFAKMVEQFDPRFDECLSAQCLHGEIHPGNVLFRCTDGSAVLVDFEESVHLFAPPAWDLAFLVQRFCLRDDPSPSVALERLKILADAYGGPLPNLTAMMRQAAWFSIAIIIDLRISQGVVTPLCERDKFVRLERQARKFECFL